MISLGEAEQLVRVLASRGQLTVSHQVAALRSLLFAEQLAFISDPSKKKCALCSRRAGKSLACAALLLLTALLNPGTKSMYFALSLGKARDTVWTPKTPMGGLLNLNSRLLLGGRPDLSRLTLELPNGSSIQVAGLDSSSNQVEKVRGEAYKLLVIDEAASQRHSDLGYSIDAVIEPALMDFDGTVVLVGTPGSMPTGYFFEATTGRDPSWSAHRWLTSQNPSMKQQYEAKVASLDMRKASNRREYLAEWVVDETLALYPGWAANGKIAPALPVLDYGDAWLDVVGCDVGQHSALVWLRYSRGQASCFVWDEWNESGRSVTEVAQQVRKWEAQNEKRFNRYIIDGAGKQTADEMRKHHQIPWEATDKNSLLKVDCIDLLDHDLATGGVKFLSDRCPRLREQVSGLAWDDLALRDRGVRELPANADDHLHDAFLYAWRECWHRQGKLQNLPPPPSEQASQMKQRDPGGYEMWQRALGEQQKREREMRKGLKFLARPVPGLKR